MSAGLDGLQFERSELAIAHINRALARFNSESAGTLASILHPSRILLLRPPATAAEWSRSRSEDALARFMAIGDEYTFGLLLDLTDAKLPRDERVAALWRRFQERDVDTWEQRFGAWGELHGINLKSYPRYDLVRAFIEARNAVIHGLGSLTPKQAKSDQSRLKTLARLEAARITVTGKRLNLTADHVRECARVVKELVRWLDGEAASAS